MSGVFALRSGRGGRSHFAAPLSPGFSKAEHAGRMGVVGCSQGQDVLRATLQEPQTPSLWRVGALG